MGKMLHGAQRSWMQWFCTCFCVRGLQKPEDPIADGAITWGSIGGLGSPL